MRFILAVLLLTTPLHAQLRESIEVNVLELDVAVVDRAGNPVDGLTHADFEVQIAGKRREVSNFYAVKRGALVDEHGRTVPPPPEAVAGETMIPVSVLILVDDTRLTPRGKQRAIEALKEYVRANVGPSTSAVIARWNGWLDVRTRPTDRPGPLLEQLDKMATEPGMLSDSQRRQMLRDIDDALMNITGIKRAHNVANVWHQMQTYAEREAREVDRTIDGIREAIELAGAFEGRKSLLYVSEGLPLAAAADVFDYWDRALRAVDSETNAHLQENIGRNHTGIPQTLDPMRYDRSRQYLRLVTTAQKANVVFYGVDAGGLRGYTRRGPEDVKAIGEINTLFAQANAQDGVRMVANDTGGRFIANENDLGRALSVLSEQFTTYYSLGVRAPASTRLLKVRVSVKNRPELRVLTSRHRKPLSREEELERTVRSRLYNQRAENPLGAEVSLGLPSSSGAQCVVPLQLSAVRNTADLYFALLDERHQESGVRSTAIAGPAHTMSLGVKPGKYVISLALADRASGETSYLQREIDARGCR